MRIRAFAVLFAVVGGLIVVGGSPSGAQQPATMTGEAECGDNDLVFLTWTISNLAGADGEVTSAVLSGVASGEIAGAFEPNPFTGADALIIGQLAITPDVVGTLTLDVVVTFDFKGPFEVDLSADIELDGSCQPPPTTEESTTTTAAAAAATATRPSFTG